MAIPTEDEIDTVINKCSDSDIQGESEYPGMTYEQGIRDAISWLKYGEENPLA